ncbi:MAG TPA: hypothetical protein DDW52_06595, partial [Planctomycetaceae bacterium]|nr:hypothetical protein [Planctomycetaceae bacterium]
YGNDQDNLLYLPAGDEGWTWDGKPGRGKMNAGRFDIGPEKVVAKRATLWQGRWKGQVVAPTKARLTSQPEPNVGVVLIRDFELLPDSTTLRCRQTIVNVSEQVVETCHWSRTFLRGKGECVVPISTFSRFPKHFVRYESGTLLNMSPDDAHVQRDGNFLLVTDAPQQPKLGFDSREGWFAYRMKQPYLFVKRFPVYPDRAYNEVAGLTISIWYPKDQMVELEPIGPAERLAPGERASFTETWDFLPGEQNVPLEELEHLVRSLPREE